MVRRHYLLYLLSILAIYLLAGCAHTLDARKPSPDKLNVAGCPDASEFAIAYIEPAPGDGMVIFVNGGNGVPVAMGVIALLDPDSLVATFGRAQMGR
jgi:hypothetical protein